MPEDMPEHMPDKMPEDMSDRMPEDLPVRKCINVMVGITRSKVIGNWRFFLEQVGKACSRKLLRRVFPKELLPISVFHFVLNRLCVKTSLCKSFSECKSLRVKGSRCKDFPV